MTAAASYAIAAAAGITGGWIFALIWTRLAPLSIQGQFWSALTSVGRGMLIAEHSHEFLDLYRRLGVALARYLGRNIGGLLIASLPLIALAGVLDSSVFEPWSHAMSWHFMFFGMATVGVLAAMTRRHWT